jgi:GT2 family glycosyltransferase
MIPVIIPFYKNREKLDRCIAHLKNQTNEVEIFIKDNSLDNTYFTAAVNHGLREYLKKTGKYTVILNQDMYLEPFAIEKMVTFMDSHPDCGIGAPLQIDSANPEYVIFAGGLEAFPAGKHQQGRLSDFTEDEEICWANGACMILRKKMIQEIGFFDENYKFIGSDSDYCFTARARGWQIWRITAAKGMHDRGTSAQLSTIEIEHIKIKDMIYFGKKWLSGELFKELAYEGNSICPGEIEQIVSELRQSESELKILSENHV